MPVTEKDLYNLALSCLGTRSRVTATNDGSKEANALNIVYADVRDELLQQHVWWFCKIRKPLVTQAVAVAPDEWSYVYARPDDCLKVRFLCAPGVPPDRYDGLPPVQYEVRIVEDDTTPTPVKKKAILCDLEDAVVCYTYQVTDPDFMTANFRLALAWKLAAAIALNLTGSREVARAAQELFAQQLDGAKAIDAQEGISRRDEQVAPWTAAR